MCEADDEGRLSGESFLELRCSSRETGPVHIDLLYLKKRVQCKGGVNCSQT